MKRQLYRITLCSILTYLALSTLNSAGAASQPSGGNGTHFCAVIDWQADNRRYTRAFAPNLNVGEPRTLRLIYFTPNDQPYRADVVQRMKDRIFNIQTFYADQMDAHGYGKVTFRIETDTQGEPMVHRVDGGQPDSYYISDLAPVFEESERAFNLKAYISLIVLDNGGSSLGDGQAAGLGERWGKNSGYAVVTGDVDFGVTAHELGHAFGLEHDFRDGAYIMSYGPGQNQLSACSAEYLSVHPYFNSDIPIERGHSPTIELISPRTYSAGSRSVPIRFQVNDSGGLHQVLLRGIGGLIECRGLAGETDALVEFNYDGAVTLQGLTLLPDAVAHGFSVEAVDTDGNWSAYMSFFLTESSPHHIAILEGHTAWLHSVSFSPDGRTLASGGEDQTVKLWDVVTQQDIGTLPHGAWVTSVAFSPVDATLLATGSKDGTVKLWDVETQRDIGTLPHGVGVTSVAFSRDGMLLASGSRDGTVKLWDVTTQQDIGTLPHGAGVTSVAFSRDGMLLASGSQDKTVKLWDVATRQKIGTLDGHSIWVYSVSFSPDERTLASTGGNTVKLWDVTTQRNIGILPHGADVTSVSFSRDGGTLASGAVDGTVKLWDVASGANFATLGNTSGVNSLSFSSDGVTLASGTGEGTIELWDTSGLMRERLEALAETDIPDPNLRAAIATALGKPPSASIVRGNMATLTRLEASKADISNLTGLEGSTNLTSLNLWGNNISDISPVAGLTKLKFLDLGDNDISNIAVVTRLTNLTFLGLWDNNISDISVVAGLTKLARLFLSGNNISDISPLVANTGLGSGDEVYILGNPLNYQSIHTHIPALQERGVEVGFQYRTPQRIGIVSGNDQQGMPDAALANPFVVEIQDQNGAAFEGVSITFAVTNGGGTLSATSATTDSNGRAESTLTLGPNPGTNTVEATVTGIAETRTFTAEGIRVPKTLEIISGVDQAGLPGDALENPFVVEVRDQFDKPLPGVEVTFSVSSGDGTLSATSATTDSNGQAESTLTLGPNPGTNTVEATVTGIEEKRTFTAEGSRVPKELEIISGVDQAGLPGDALEKPFVVEVRDQSDKPFPGVEVTFTVTAGGGKVQPKIATTDENGRAESTLTLGPNPGTNTVEATVTGIAEKRTFNAEGNRIPKALEIISGVDQAGLPGDALEKAFVVEVRDQTDKPLAGVEVTFSVSSGDGTLSATSATTDSNGRAESTLTLGPNLGKNSVRVSVEGISQPESFTVVGIRPQFDLSLPAGISLIHIPIRATAVDDAPLTIESMSDLYDALGGAEKVNFLVTRDAQRWRVYFGSQNRGTSGDKALTDDLGIIAAMKDAVTIHLAGDSLGRNGNSVITLHRGTNLVGVPLRDSRIMRVTDLLSLEGIRGNVPSIFVSAQGKFVEVRRAADDGNISITGGQSFVLEARDAATVAISGNGWYNTSGTTAAPSVAVTGIEAGDVTPVLALRGSIVDEVRVWSGRGREAPPTGSGFRVTVKNLSTSKAVTAVTGGEHVSLPDKGKLIGVGYQLAVVDMESGRAARVGDVLEVSTETSNPLIRVRSLRYTVTAADVRNSRIQLPELVAYEIPTETALLPNYPNPFNPETWIPYQLAEDADVTLTIYDTKGVTVRRLDLGHQLAGYYADRGKAAYWDGRNNQVESVASGLYFYQLATPSFRQLRRMVILK